MGVCDGCPPFGGAICGITDTFNPNQFNARPNGVNLGIADCGREWTVQLGNPMTIEGQEMYVPTRLVGHTSAHLPGNYPVPFNGRIQATSADIHAGFSYVTTRGPRPEGFGPAWDDGDGYVDGTTAYVGGYSIHPHLNGGQGVSSDALAAPIDRRHFNPEAPVTVTGHIKMVETDSGTVTDGDRPGSVGPTLDEYIGVTLGLYVEIIGDTFPIGGAANVAALLIDDGLGTYVYSFFPADWWRDVGEGDFEISHSGGRGGTVTATVAGVTVSSAIDAGAPIERGVWGAFNDSNDHADAWRVPCAEMQISDVVIGGKQITDLNWEWRLNGTVVDGGGISFRFGYVSMGGAIPFGFAYPGDDISEDATDAWPYTAPSPAIWAWGSHGQLTVVPLGGDLDWPFTPIVTIAGNVATLDIGGVSASVATPAQIVTLDDTLAGLGHYARNGQGEYLLFNDLDVIGVNLCTDTGITSGRPNRDQEVRDEYVGLGDGVTTTFYTDYPYQPGTLAIDVAGMLGDLDSSDPPAGAFTLVDAPPVGAVVRATYRVAQVTVPTIPGPPGPPPGTPGDRPFAAPVTTGAPFVVSGVDDTGATDAWPDWQAFIDSVPDGSVIEGVAGATYLMSAGFLFQQRNNIVLDLKGATVLMDPAGDGDDEAFTTFLMRGSHHIRVTNAVVVGTDWGFPSVAGERAHLLATSGFFNQGPSTYIEMDTVTASFIHGDAIYLEGDNAVPNYVASDHIWAHSWAVDFVGRNGISLIAAKNVLIENFTINHPNYHVIDAEPNYPAQVVDGVTIRNFTVGGYSYRAGLLGFLVRVEGLPVTGVGARVTNLTVDDFTVDGNPANGYDGTARGLNSRVVSTGGTRHANIKITNGSTPQSVDTTFGAGGVLYFAHVDGIDVTGNTQPLGVGGEMARFDDCTNTVGP